MVNCPAGEDGGKEAVRAVAVGKGPEKSPGVDEVGGKSLACRRDAGKLRAVFQQVGDDQFVFLRRDGADAVDEPASRPHARGGARQEPPLGLHAFFQIRRGDPPADLRIPPEGAEARAGGVQEDPVEGPGKSCGRLPPHRPFAFPRSSPPAVLPPRGASATVRHGDRAP